MAVDSAKGNPASHRMSNTALKDKRARSRRNGEQRKQSRIKAQQQREADNKTRRSNGFPTPWEESKAARKERRAVLRRMGMLPTQPRDKHGFIIKQVVKDGDTHEVRVECCRKCTNAAIVRLQMERQEDADREQEKASARKARASKGKGTPAGKGADSRRKQPAKASA